MSNLELAIEIAVKTHQGQKDLAGEPYILHPLRVMLDCNSEDARIVAVLHDVIEVGAFALEYLRVAGFNEHILESIDAITKRDGEKYDDYIERVIKSSLAREVKLADLRHNLDVSRLKRIGKRETRRLNKYKKAYTALKG